MAKTSLSKANKDLTQAPTGEKPADADDQMPRASMADGSDAQGGQDSVDRDERIRQAAYRRFLDRGGEHGYHDDDWRAAEADEEVRPPDGN